LQVNEHVERCRWEGGDGSTQLPDSPGQKKWADLGQCVVADYCYQTNFLKQSKTLQCFHGLNISSALLSACYFYTGEPDRWEEDDCFVITSGRPIFKA
jgi:hypothetical protein